VIRILLWWSSIRAELLFLREKLGLQAGQKDLRGEAREKSTSEGVLE
jgi:hypothetical protein